MNLLVIRSCIVRFMPVIWAEFGRNSGRIQTCFGRILTFILPDLEEFGLLYEGFTRSTFASYGMFLFRFLPKLRPIFARDLAELWPNFGRTSYILVVFGNG